ncbi:MAG: J domain-containing protein, partial [Candidatus Omnitrophota bacterium]
SLTGNKVPVAQFDFRSLSQWLNHAGTVIAARDNDGRFAMLDSFKHGLYMGPAVYLFSRPSEIAKKGSLAETIKFNEAKIADTKAGQILSNVYSADVFGKKVGNIWMSRGLISQAWVDAGANLSLAKVAGLAKTAGIVTGIERGLKSAGYSKEERDILSWVVLFMLPQPVLRPEKQAVVKINKVLGIDVEKATRDQVKGRFRALALETHPDRHTDLQQKEAAQERYKEISSAYKTYNDLFYKGEINSPKHTLAIEDRTNKEIKISLKDNAGLTVEKKNVWQKTEITSDAAQKINALSEKVSPYLKPGSLMQDKMWDYLANKGLAEDEIALTIARSWAKNEFEKQPNKVFESRVEQTQAALELMRNESIVLEVPYEKGKTDAEIIARVAQILISMRQGQPLAKHLIILPTQTNIPNYENAPSLKAAKEFGIPVTILRDKDVSKNKELAELNGIIILDAHARESTELNNNILSLKLGPRDTITYDDAEIVFTSAGTTTGKSPLPELFRDNYPEAYKRLQDMVEIMKFARDEIRTSVRANPEIIQQIDLDTGPIYKLDPKVQQDALAKIKANPQFSHIKFNEKAEAIVNATLEMALRTEMKVGTRDYYKVSSIPYDLPDNTFTAVDGRSWAIKTAGEKRTVTFKTADGIVPEKSENIPLDALLKDSEGRNWKVTEEGSFLEMPHFAIADRGNSRPHHVYSSQLEAAGLSVALGFSDAIVMMDLARDSGRSADIYSHLAKIGTEKVSVISGNLEPVEPILKDVLGFNKFVKIGERPGLDERLKIIPVSANKAGYNASLDGIIDSTVKNLQQYIGKAKQPTIAIDVEAGSSSEYISMKLRELRADGVIPKDTVVVGMTGRDVGLKEKQTDTLKDLIRNNDGKQPIIFVTTVIEAGLNIFPLELPQEAYEVYVKVAGQRGANKLSQELARGSNPLTLAPANTLGRSRRAPVVSFEVYVDPLNPVQTPGMSVAERNSFLESSSKLYNDKGLASESAYGQREVNRSREYAKQILKKQGLEFGKTQQVANIQDNKFSAEEISKLSQEIQERYPIEYKDKVAATEAVRDQGRNKASPVEAINAEKSTLELDNTLRSITDINVKINTENWLTNPLNGFIKVNPYVGTQTMTQSGKRALEIYQENAKRSGEELTLMAQALGLNTQEINSDNKVNLEKLTFVVTEAMTEGDSIAIFDNLRGSGNLDALAKFGIDISKEQPDLEKNLRTTKAFVDNGLTLKDYTLFISLVAFIQQANGAFKDVTFKELLNLASPISSYSLAKTRLLKEYLREDSNAAQLRDKAKEEYGIAEGTFVKAKANLDKSNVFNRILANVLQNNKKLQSAKLLPEIVKAYFSAKKDLAGANYALENKYAPEMAKALGLRPEEIKPIFFGNGQLAGGQLPGNVSGQGQKGPTEEPRLPPQQIPKNVPPTTVNTLLPLPILVGGNISAMKVLSAIHPYVVIGLGVAALGTIAFLAYRNRTMSTFGTQVLGQAGGVRVATAIRAIAGRGIRQGRETIRKLGTVVGIVGTVAVIGVAAAALVSGVLVVIEALGLVALVELTKRGAGSAIALMGIVSGNRNGGWASANKKPEVKLAISTSPSSGSLKKDVFVS